MSPRTISAAAGTVALAVVLSGCSTKAQTTPSGGSGAGGVKTGVGVTDKEITLDGATTILEAGESLGVQLPFGCRMGICQTCVVPLAEGYVRDLGTGEERREGERIQTCVSAVSGACTIEQ